MPPRDDLGHPLSIISNYLIVRVDAFKPTPDCINRRQVAQEIANSLVLGVPERTKTCRGTMDKNVRLSGQCVELPKQTKVGQFQFEKKLSFPHIEPKREIISSKREIVSSKRSSIRRDNSAIIASIRAPASEAGGFCTLPSPTARETCRLETASILAAMASKSGGC